MAVLWRSSQRRRRRDQPCRNSRCAGPRTSRGRTATRRPMTRTTRQPSAPPTTRKAGWSSTPSFSPPPTNESITSSTPSHSFGVGQRLGSTQASPERCTDAGGVGTRRAPSPSTPPPMLSTSGSARARETAFASDRASPQRGVTSSTRRPRGPESQTAGRSCASWSPRPSATFTWTWLLDTAMRLRTGPMPQLSTSSPSRSEMRWVKPSTSPVPPSSTTLHTVQPTCSGWAHMP